MTAIAQVSGPSFYEVEVERFLELVKTNRRYAFERYGWSFFHSLPPDEKHILRQELGWEDTTGLDFYNTGTLACRSGKLDEGLPLLEKAEQMGLDIPELWFNLGLAYDMSGNPAQAKNHWETFIDKLERQVRIPVHYRDDLDEVRERLSSM